MPGQPSAAALVASAKRVIDTHKALAAVTKAAAQTAAMYPTPATPKAGGND